MILSSSESPSRFSMSYLSLPESFFSRVAPTPVSEPKMIRLNEALAAKLGLSLDELKSPDGLSVLAGNKRFDGFEPFAMAYAGHQFGNWVPALGDGRAIQIGAVLDSEGNETSIQLKGAGPTPYSRQGDGRAAIGPVLREYILSEAMFSLGVPTTRALAAVTTGEAVYRDRPERGAILTRVAAGFVRVGTFEYFSARGQVESVKALAEYVIVSRYPGLMDSPHPFRSLLGVVVESQADLIARWMHLGFIHGVMNTDNMSVMGETIDYGPCAFLDEYNPSKVFSSIDRFGRYAFQQQPNIGLWNLTRFAESLLPLLGENEDEAVEVAQSILGEFEGHFRRFYDAGMSEKLGLSSSNDQSRSLSSDLLELMGEASSDYTLTFRYLSSVLREGSVSSHRFRGLFKDPSGIESWLGRWQEVLRAEGVSDEVRSDRMLNVNPLFIPRNHRVQQVIDRFVEQDDLGPLESMLSVLSSPFVESARNMAYADPPEPSEVVRQTFCGT